MLPLELLFHLSSFLNLEDIKSLSETNRDNYEILKPIRYLFFKCPYYRLEYSQYDTWQACAVKYKPADYTMLFKRANIPRYLDKPLPADFQCLEGDRNLFRPGCDTRWKRCDRGIVSTRTGDVLDLRTFSPVRCLSHVNGYRKSKNGDMNVYKNTSVQTQMNHQLSASLSKCKWCNGNHLRITYHDGRPERIHTLEGEEVSFYLIHDMVLIRTECHDYHAFLALPGTESLLTIAIENDFVHSYLLYNGRLYKAMVDWTEECIVASLMYDPFYSYFSSSDLRYEIVQDVRHPRYALVYEEKTGILSQVIDLETRRVSKIAVDWRFRMFGISDGKLGMWEFSDPFLTAICISQIHPVVPEVVEMVSEIFAKVRQYFDYDLEWWGNDDDTDGDGYSSADDEDDSDDGGDEDD